MVKDYGVYQDGTVNWVTNTDPLTLGSADQATLYTETDAMAVAAYLTQSQSGETFKVGRPDDRKPH